MVRKLKVYAAEIDGLHEWIVAAANQGEALAAFGVNQNLFQQGLAHPAEDAAAIEAAQASPGVPLRRLKGSKAAFQPADADAGDAWEKAAKAAGVKASRRKPVKKDRRELDRAEAALAAFEEEAREEEAALDRAAEALEERRRALASGQTEQRYRLRQAVHEAKQAYERHG